MMYLILAKYSDEAERKRIEYAMERWGKEMKLGRPDGVSIIVEEENEKTKEFLDDLYSRTSKDKVKIYKLSEASFELEEKEVRIKTELEGGLETVDKFIGFILAKLNAFFQRDIPSGKLYKVSTKKGQAEISTRMTASNNKVMVDIRINGYGDAPDLIYNKVNNELKYFKEV
ncbi:MAG: hypothetical protein L6282_19105 [Candidatus Methanoperedenaceae archaeon]|nr:hypothetical protein [Candidatus Methanoperedenaceae archaeon]